jgi:DcaP outer membrane protein
VSHFVEGSDVFDVSWRSFRVVAIVTLTLLTVLSAVPQARAAAAKPAKAPTPSLSTRVANQQKQLDAQRAMIEKQQALVAEQQALLQARQAVADSQSATIRDQQKALLELQEQLDAMQRRLDELSSQAGLPAVKKDLEDRLRQVEAATQKAPELPPDVVAAGDFPGSIRIPGSDAAVKFGGRIRTAVVLTLDPLGTDDRFLTNSIPVGDSVASGEDKRTNISARASRLNIEFRTPGGKEEVRAFFEGDFAGASNTLRLRHAYAQYRGVIAGQTWSTFSDPGADHNDLDFEGVSSENLIRQPQIRYWWSPKPGTRLAVAVETPSVSITGGQGVNLFPDAIARAYHTTSEVGHLQVAAVLRQIRAQTGDATVQHAWAGGGTVSGVVPFRVKDLTDRVIFQVNAGTGIARYINDLSSLGGQDAVVDTATGDLRALPAIGWYVAYEHVWKVWAAMQEMNMRSMVMWSYVGVQNYDFQPADAYHMTNRLAVNAILSPSSRVDLGLEYIYGNRFNHDGASGRANQVQVVGLFRF